LIALANESNYQKICQYLIACSSYVPEEEDVEVLRVTMEIYKKLNKPTEAVRIAIRLGRKDIIKEILNSADPLVQKQIAYMLARHNLYEVVADNDDYDLKEIAGNNKLNEHFLALVKELDVLEPKKPEEDIFKSHLSDIKAPLNAKADSARTNLAVTFVNAFVNAGFGTDKLMLTNEEGNNWVFKNKDHGMLSASASIGMLYLWDISTGLNQIDKYTLSNDDNIKAGAVLAGGLLCAGYRNDDIDPAVGFLPNYLEDKSNLVKTCACLGLGVAYAGSSREDIKGLLMTAFDNQTNNMESLGLIALALGLVFVGTGDAEISESFLSAFLEQTETALKSTYARYLCLGLGLLYLGKQEVAELTIEALKAISGPIGKYAMLTVETCAYMGSGNVLKIQKLLADCGEHPTTTPEEEAQKEKERDAGKEKDKEKEEKEKEEQNKKMAHQGVAVLGIAGIAMCEDVGSQMSMRSFDHLLQYGEPSVRRAVPLAMALINVSNADLGIMDTLSKLSHDHDPEVAMGAIFALGIVGAGTNNARIAQLLRQLASYYYKDPNMLFLVRIAQGFLHMGKGTIGAKPYHSERLLLNPVATAGLLAVMHSGLDMKNIILGKSPYMMYLLSLAMYPRALIAVNEDGEPINVSVRVGQAVDVIGQAGKPKTITGFQTHNTPVLLSHGERAELATDMYIPVASILEGVVIMKTNPDSKDAKKKKKEEAKATTDKTSS
jgi:26S proteasome regulatory subunit N1